MKHFIGIATDITNQKVLEDQLLHQATHDTLTELPNRSLLLDRIQQDIIHVRRTNLLIGVLFIDLDQFKIINDSLGHMVGDKLLKVVAERLVQGTHDSATVARMGGDEFVVIFADA